MSVKGRSKGENNIVQNRLKIFYLVVAEKLLLGCITHVE